MNNDILNDIHYNVNFVSEILVHVENFFYRLCHQSSIVVKWIPIGNLSRQRNFSVYFNSVSDYEVMYKLHIIKFQFTMWTRNYFDPLNLCKVALYCLKDNMSRASTRIVFFRTKSFTGVMFSSQNIQVNT